MVAALCCRSHLTPQSQSIRMAFLRKPLTAPSNFKAAVNTMSTTMAWMLLHPDLAQRP
jgi:hypothetical protein